jgi:mannose-6-phosphate isomerase-like protein (cupin superfamily)
MRDVSRIRLTRCKQLRRKLYSFQGTKIDRRLSVCKGMRSIDPIMADVDSRSEAEKSFPYTTHLNILYESLQCVDVQSLVDACTDSWYNQTLCRVNDSVVRLGVMQGEYHWHKHDDLDEFFYVLSGRFLIDLEGRTQELMPNQGFVVPRGVLHRTRAPEHTVILMVEGAGIVPTGD